MKELATLYCVFHVSFLLALPFDLEDGEDTFLRNIG
jgi:hypothetical protein